MQLLGLHIDRPFFRIALLEKKGGKVEVRSIKSIPFSSADDVKELYIPGWRGTVGTAVPALVRHLDFKISSIPQIELGLPFQIESLTHLPIEDICYTAQIEPSQKGARATVFLIPREDLRAHLEEWKTFSIEPDFVTAQSQAMAAFANDRCPNLKSAFLINLGSQEWSCAWMEEGKIKRFFALSTGIESLLAALWEDRKNVLFLKEVEGVAKQIDLLQIKPLLNPHLSERIEEQRKKLAGILYSFQQVAGPRPLLFTGWINAFGRLPEYLAQTSSQLPIYSPPIPFRPEEQKCALALGTALELAAKRSRPVQFLQKELVSRKTLRRAGFWATTLIAASFLASATLLWIGRGQIQKKKEEMADSLKKYPFTGELENAIATIEKHGKESPYLLLAPTVAEFLSWLSNHPLLEVFAQGGDPMEIINVRYQLVSMPKIGSMKDPYSAKAELEFRFKSPMNARKFHEALLNGDEWVDPGEEIAWESLSNSNRVTFTLRNRSAHVL